MNRHPYKYCPDCNERCHLNDQQCEMCGHVFKCVTTHYIKALILSAVNQLKFLMDRGIVFRSLERYRAIEKVSNQFSLEANSVAVQLQWINHLRAEMIEILPPAAGRFKKLRNKLTAFL